MISDNARLTLVPGIYFTRLGQQVYVRDVNAHFDYLFNASAETVLKSVKNHCTFCSLMEQMCAEYLIRDFDMARKKVEGFLLDLASKRIVNIVEEDFVTRSEVSDREHIIDRVDEYCRTHTRLWTACLEITYRCNEKCRHCYLDDPAEKDCGKELSKEVWFRIIDELIDAGAMSILVTGGEPTLRSDFVEICQHIVERGALVDVYTNALKISPSVFESLVRMKLNSVSFSLYGGTSDFHDYVTQVPGSFNATLRNILAFKCAGIDVFVKTVPFNGHLEEYKLLHHLCKMLNLRLNITQQIVSGHSGRDNVGFMYSEDEFREYVEYAIKQGDMRIIKTPSGGFLRRDLNGPICKAGHTTLSIDPYGNVSCCNSYPVKLGNLLETSVKSIWENSPELMKIRSCEFKDVSEACLTCIYSGQCSYCPGAAYQENGVTLKPCKLTCRNAKIQYDVKKSMSDFFAVPL